MPGADEGKGSVQGRRAARKERLADKLRQNLIRRKGPARAARNEEGARAARNEVAQRATRTDMADDASLGEKGDDVPPPAASEREP